MADVTNMGLNEAARTLHQGSGLVAQAINNLAVAQIAAALIESGRTSFADSAVNQARRALNG